MSRKLSRLRTIHPVTAFKDTRVEWRADRDNVEITELPGGRFALKSLKPMPDGIPDYIELGPAIVESVVPIPVVPALSAQASVKK